MLGGRKQGHNAHKHCSGSVWGLCSPQVKSMLIQLYSDRTRELKEKFGLSNELRFFGENLNSK